MEKQVRIHEEWDDNLFLTLPLDNGFEAESKKAEVVVKREIELSRQSMVPMEGKAVLAYWDDRADQLVALQLHPDPAHDAHRPRAVPRLPRSRCA